MSRSPGSPTLCGGRSTCSASTRWSTCFQRLGFALIFAFDRQVEAELIDATDYEVIVTREHGLWLADVPAVPGAHTFARSLAGLTRSVRKVIMLMAGLGDEATPGLSFTYQVSDEVVHVLKNIVRASPLKRLKLSGIDLV